TVRSGNRPSRHRFDDSGKALQLSTSGGDMDARNRDLAGQTCARLHLVSQAFGYGGFTRGIDKMPACRAGWCWAAAFVFHLALMNSWADAQKVPAAGSHRWAVIATDPQMAAMADLLTVDLSRLPRLQLVERTQIQLALDELRLSGSGLTATANTLRFGKLAKADALILLD